MTNESKYYEPESYNGSSRPTCDNLVPVEFSIFLGDSKTLSMDQTAHLRNTNNDKTSLRKAITILAHSLSKATWLYQQTPF